MKRLGAAFATFLAVAMLLQGSAYAGLEWCAEDPVLTVLGSQFSITTYVHTSASSVSGIAYVVDVPSNAGRVKVSYPGGKPIPTTVRITYNQPEFEEGSTFHVVTTVSVTAPSGTDVRVELGGTTVAPLTFTGTSGQALTFGIDVTATDD